MTYLAIYAAVIAVVLWIVYAGWPEALKSMLSILIPLVLIILFNAKAGRLLFRNPIVGIISILPTAVFIFNVSQPLVVRIHSFIDKKTNDFVEMKDVVEAEVISKEEA